jgi:hypothetical protein
MNTLFPESLKREKFRSLSLPDGSPLLDGSKSLKSVRSEFYA